MEMETEEAVSAIPRNADELNIFYYYLRLPTRLCKAIINHESPLTITTPPPALGEGHIFSRRGREDPDGKASTAVFGKIYEHFVAT